MAYKINVCVKCGSDDILITNCGYSSFNAGSGKCNKCGNKVLPRNGPWDNDDWIVSEWNYRNPTKEVEILRLEKQIEELRDKIEETKQREW